MQWIVRGRGGSSFGLEGFFEQKSLKKKGNQSSGSCEQELGRAENREVEKKRS